MSQKSPGNLDLPEPTQPPQPCTFCSTASDFTALLTGVDTTAVIKYVIVGAYTLKSDTQRKRE